MLGTFLFFPVTGYAQDDHEPIREMLTDPGTLLGLGDGGAHVAHDRRRQHATRTC